MTFNFFVFLSVLVLVLALCYSLPQKSRQKRQTYELPDGAELLLSVSKLNQELHNLSVNHDNKL